jgi:hypothetical protein
MYAVETATMRIITSHAQLKSESTTEQEIVWDHCWLISLSSCFALGRSRMMMARGVGGWRLEVVGGLQIPPQSGLCRQERKEVGLIRKDY